MADETPSNDQFIPVEAPKADASGSSPSMADTIKLALDQVKADDADEDAEVVKPVKAADPREDKPAKEPVKDEDKPDDEAGEKAPSKDKEAKAGEGEKASDDGDEAKPAKRADDDRGLIKPPSRLLPDAAEKWANTPRAVQRDIDAMVKSYETEIETAKKATERYEAIKPFDELAQQSGRDLRESLMKINHFENMMRQNPIAALDAILKEIGPRKQDGGALSVIEIAHWVANNQQQASQAVNTGHQQAAKMQQQAEQQAVAQELAQLRAEKQAHEIEKSVIEPFRQSHPRFDELRHEIASELLAIKAQYGNGFYNLSYEDKLDLAYSRAELLKPPSGKQDEDQSSLEPDRVDLDSSGRKSIRSGPGSVTSHDNGVDATDVKALIRNNLRKAIRA